MNLRINVKQLGRKHPLIENTVLEIEDIGSEPDLRALLLAVVAQQVAEYNNKAHTANLLSVLSKDEIATQVGSGKVGFNVIYNENKAALLPAQQAVLQAFEDGLFAVFVDDEQCESLNTLIPITQHTVVTFIRLTFLAGSYW